VKITTKGRYAIRAILDLAYHNRGEPIPISNVAIRQEISQPYLEHLFGKLRKAGLVKSIRGPGGGYLLARAPDKISVREVFLAVEESVTPVECGAIDGNPTACNKVDQCISLVLWRKLARSIVDTLDSISLADLCEESSKVEKASVPEHNYIYNI
jgi:Rrf2 family iron-sulfur cluster assembly transcriptional regulator